MSRPSSTQDLYLVSRPCSQEKEREKNRQGKFFTETGMSV